MFTVALLLDKENNWLRNFIPKKLFDREDIEASLFYEKDKVKNFDIVFVLGFTKILDNNFLKNNSLVLIVHESNLPEGKGFAPLQWQVLEGKNKIVFSLIEAAEEFDSGDIFDQEELVLDGTELYDEIRFKQATLTFKLLEKFLETYPKYKRMKQIGKSTFYRKRIGTDSELDINMTIKELFPLLRIVNNKDWPGFFKLNGVTYFLKIYKKGEIND